MKKCLLLTIAVSLFLIACSQKDQSTEDRTWIQDNEKVLTGNQIHVLDSIIRVFESETTNEIAIITVDSIADSLTMREYAVSFGDKFGIGKKGKDNGLIILFSRSRQEVFIATGIGTESVLSNEMCESIVNTSMIPFFMRKDYFGGLKSGLEECIYRWK